jgi:hypothetical protein
VRLPGKLDEDLLGVFAVDDRDQNGADLVEALDAVVVGVLGREVMA